MKIIRSNKIPSDFYPSGEYEQLDIVKTICTEVKFEGDVALRKYSLKFDKIGDASFEISDQEISDAYEIVDEPVIDALKFAIKNIREFANLQMKNFRNVELETSFGKFGHKVIPLDAVLCYIPGGRYPLPSTALMTIIPAKVAGVQNINASSPNIDPLTIVACDLAGATKIFRVGGIQAIAAFAYGTESIEKVDKIVGPGNKFVTLAKKYVYGKVGIDFLAGPSEVLIIADEFADPKWIAADLLAQAEHDPESRADLITNSNYLAETVVNEIKIQKSFLSTNSIIEKSMSKSKIILVDRLEEAIQISNKKCPEHIVLHTKETQYFEKNLRNYGSLFIGCYSSEVFGDYCSGPNHTLPTNGGSRYTGGLSVKDFIKLQTYQKISRENIKLLSTMTYTLAKQEGLEAHAQAAKIRNKVDS